MKKVLFLTLTLFLFTLGTVRLTAQVAIGKAESPHPDALLELKSNSRGLLLPQVALTGVANFLVNGGDRESAKGMLVYNTNNYALDGAGLYVWTGVFWQSCKPGECPLPGKPAFISFSPTLTNDIPVNTLITLTSGLAYGASTYEWTVPEAFEIVGNVNTKTITVRALQTGDFNAAGISVKAVNYCGKGDTVRGSGTIMVKDPVSPPAMPTLVLASGLDLNPGDSVTISCGDVGADEYIWTLPAGITAISATTTVNRITVAVAVGVYESNTFKVKAKNIAGESALRTGSGGRIVAKTCSSPPDGNIRPFTSQSYTLGSHISFQLMVNIEGTTRYQWEAPEGLTMINDTARTLTVRCDKLGTYNAGDVKVRITNNCDQVTVSGTGSFKVVDVAGTGSAGTVTGNSGTTYTTYTYPNGLGTWMTQNSKEGTPIETTSPGQAPGERGYYYDANSAPSACPTGWVLPAQAQIAALWSHLGGMSSVNAQNEPWLASAARAGKSDGTDWNLRAYYRTTTGTQAYYVTDSAQYTNITTAGIDEGFPVRCVKNACDMSPQALSFSRVFRTVVPVGVTDSMLVGYRNFRSDTTVVWTLPSWLSLVSETKDKVVFQYNTPGIHDWSDLTCTVTNSCGSSTISGSGSLTITGDLGSDGPDLVIPGGGTYKTYNFPAGIGTWMLTPLKEQPAAYIWNEGGPSPHGHLYDRTSAQSMCPNGWRLPTDAEMFNYNSYRAVAQNQSNIWLETSAPRPFIYGRNWSMGTYGSHGYSAWTTTQNWSIDYRMIGAWGAGTWTSGEWGQILCIKK